MGKIEADINVGGIAGAMAIEYDLDPEDDISAVGNRSLNFRYETKAVALRCRNYGSVISKKNCAGGIVGRMDLGTAAECEGYGYVQSTNGDYVGRILGCLRKRQLRQMRTFGRKFFGRNNRQSVCAGKLPRYNRR